MRRTILILAVLALTAAAAWRRGDAYILHSGDDDVTMMTGTDIEAVVAAHKRFGQSAPYMWTRIAGREYLIRDAAFLRDATELWAPVHALKPEEKALSREEKELDRRIDAMEDHPRAADRAELQELRERYRVVERRMREIDERQEALEKVVEAKLRDMVDAAIRDGRAKPLR